MICIENVSHDVAGNTILNDISVTIPKGQVTALVGPNGAGKSTLLSLVARLMPISKGTITIDDLKVGVCSSDALARKLAILPQRMEVMSRLTVKELVTFGRYPHSKGRINDTDRKIVDEAIDVFDLGEFANRPLETLSGGQQQRAFLAMTFAQDTDYILLDEPLNNLDIAASRKLMHLLCELCEKHNKTIIIVLHDINFAARYADNLIAMTCGECSCHGRPDEMITECFMQSVFGTTTSIQHINGKPVVLV